MKHINIATGVIEHEGKFLIARRLEPEWLKGQWEFPGGTQEEGESLKSTLIREIKEETNLDIEADKVDYSFTDIVNDDLKITINFFRAKIIGEINIKLDEHSEYTWVNSNDYQNYEWTKLTKVYADRLFKKG